MTCGYCKQKAKKVTGKEVYPHRPDLYSKKFFQCEPCQAHVGCHPGQGYKPLGRLANANLRRLKQEAHFVFDPIWKNGTKSRKGAYRWLADRLGIAFEDCHIGWADEIMCERVIYICKEAQRAGLGND